MLPTDVGAIQGIADRMTPFKPMKAVQCPYGPHWHEPPREEEAVYQCRKELMKYLSYDQLRHLGFTDFEIETTNMWPS